MNNLFDPLPPPSDLFSAPYGYFENLPARTLSRLHSGAATVQKTSPLWRFKWSGLAFLLVLSFLIWGRMAQWGGHTLEKSHNLALNAALIDLPEAARIDYLLSHSPSPDPDWLSVTEMSTTPIIEARIAAEVLDENTETYMPADYEWALMTEIELIDTP